MEIFESEKKYIFGNKSADNVQEELDRVKHLLEEEKMTLKTMETLNLVALLHRCQPEFILYCCKVIKSCIAANIDPYILIDMGRFTQDIVTESFYKADASIRGKKAVLQRQKTVSDKTKLQIIYNEYQYNLREGTKVRLKDLFSKYFGTLSDKEFNAYKARYYREKDKIILDPEANVISPNLFDELAQFLLEENVYIVTGKEDGIFERNAQKVYLGKKQRSKIAEFRTKTKREELYIKNNNLKLERPRSVPRKNTSRKK